MKAHFMAPLLALMLAVAPPPAEQVGLQEVIAKSIAAYGGLEALSGVTAIRQRGKVHSKTRHVGEAWELQRIFRTPQFLRVAIVYPSGHEEVRVLNGPQGFRNGKKVSGPPLDAMRIQAARLALPLLLHQRTGALIDRGEVQREGKKLRRVELALGGVAALTVEIDLASGLILRSTGIFMAGSPAAPEFTTTYSDFREVDGVLFPFREANYVSDQHVADTLLESIELLEAPPPDAFWP